ncbi:unnamed protein product [Rotaria magnacalcarata]|uniref:Uncharacterized protein n=1 Tax=Rotaria magnacalcarata TaxID=392030 RepID=A0A818ZQ84_9BILA|nr:unnamed protein product [Rotaria magnacalcarata]CAF3770840.1 unnamed protein product [Rotaria magnacalcarata]
MNRSHTHLGTYYSRNLSLHKPGTIPKSCRNISPITSSHHKYELKQKIWPKQTVEAWFQNHSSHDRRAVYSFLNTLYDSDDDRSQVDNRSSIERRRRSPSPRLPSRVNTVLVNSLNHPLQRRMSSNDRHESRRSKRDLGEILETLESLRHSPPLQEKGIQTLTTPLTIPLPNVNGINNGRKTEEKLRRSSTTFDKYTETVQPEISTDSTSNVNVTESPKTSVRYLSNTWRVINPREDMEQNVRPENNRSSFFNFTKKVYPEYFFIHPDWY